LLGRPLRGRIVEVRACLDAAMVAEPFRQNPV
jgi:hypothetical protein